LLLSMTGHGAAECQGDGALVRVELRAVNNRFLKISTRISESFREGFHGLEPRVEGFVRRHVRRGSLQVNVRIEREPSPEEFHLNDAVLLAYRRQLDALNQRVGVSTPVGFEALVGLPGVVSEGASPSGDPVRHWPVVASTLSQALDRLSEMRRKEGRAMADDLLRNVQIIAARLEQVQRRAPTVVAAYRQRLLERVNGLLADHATDLQPSDIVREVGVYADRSDISEETVRLRSHLEQFQRVLEGEQSDGRKLEFLSQEMLREANTIGSKANDAVIAHEVVEIKAALERMREMLQNVE